jgi:hypothetical protein
MGPMGPMGPNGHHFLILAVAMALILDFHTCQEGHPRSRQQCVMARVEAAERVAC